MIKVPKVLQIPKNKPEFPDDITHLKDLSALAPRHIEFDWEVLRRALGEAKDECGEADYELLAQIMRELLRWVVKGDKLGLIGRRAVALAWTINPDMFNGSSAAKLARKVGCYSVRLNEDAAEASRAFGVRNRAQGHAWNFKPAKPKRR